MTMRAPFRGVFTALLTPFSDGKIDEKAFASFVKWQMDEGIHGLVPCGTTGETPTLSTEEQARLIEIAVATAKNRVPVIAGCGSNDTAKAVRLTQQAEKLGVDAALQVVPYYNKPTQEGIYQHFKAIHDGSHLPIILYNVPGRTVASISVETMERLAQLPRIVGVKDATGDLTRVHKTRATCGDDFVQLTGEDALVLPYLSFGGQGIISVTSNVAPGLCASLYNAFVADNLGAAQAANDKLMPLHDALFIETSPGPAKFAASLLGLCRNEFRLPLVPVSRATEAAVQSAMRHAGLIDDVATIKRAV